MEGLSAARAWPPSGQDQGEATYGFEEAVQFLQGLPYPALWIDPTRQIRWRNSAAVEAYGPGDQPCYKLLHGFDTPCPEYGDRCPMVEATFGQNRTVRHVHQTTRGPEFFLIAPLPISVYGVFCVHLPIEDSLLRDALTRLYTRSAFEQLVEMQLQLLRRLKLGYAVILADVDRLKVINDRSGHAAGDDALATTARTIAASVRAADCVGRWGGDEFCAFLPSASRKDAESLVLRIQQALSEVRLENFPEIELEVSFGVAAAHEQYDLARAVQRADKALYRAKQRRVC